jgi:beta-glucosidase
MLINFVSKDENGKQTVSLPLETGKEYSIKLEYYCHKDPAAISFAWYPEKPDFTHALEAAKHADAVVLAMGFNEDLEQENLDRTFELPQYEDSLINAIAKINSKTVVIINAGGNVAMQEWLPHVPAVLHAWYPGQEGGTAIAEVLFGKTNPSGKLPASFEKEWKDNPVYHSYYDENHTKHVNYKEGLFLGYRYWDTTKIQPAFPFGYGLSYTKFDYSNLKLTRKGANQVIASFDIKNTGNFDGAEVAELYIHQKQCPVIRPLKELKGSAKIYLRKGETKKITINLDTTAFEYYHPETQRFSYDAGEFDILIGASSKDLPLQERVNIQ